MITFLDLTLARKTPVQTAYGPLWLTGLKMAPLGASTLVPAPLLGFNRAPLAYPRVLKRPPCWMGPILGPWAVENVAWKFFWPGGSMTRCSQCGRPGTERAVLTPSGPMVGHLCDPCWDASRARYCALQEVFQALVSAGLPPALADRQMQTFMQTEPS